MKLSIGEVLSQAAKKKSKEEKIAFLLQHNHIGLRTILKATFCSSWKFLLPPGTPPYKVYEGHDAHGALYTDARRLYLFAEGGNQNLTAKRREFLFVQMLESVMPEDAELLCAMKEKKLPYKGLTKNIIKEAFPGLIEEDVEDTKEVSKK